MRQAKSEGIQHFLASTGILETGSHTEIEALKADYWRRYRNAWKKEKLKRSKRITITVSLPEYKLLLAAAKRHNRSLSKFVNDSSLAYCNRDLLCVDPAGMRDINQHLMMTYHLLTAFLETEPTSEEVANKVSSEISALHSFVRERTEFPVLLRTNSCELADGSGVHQNVRP